MSGGSSTLSRPTSADPDPTLQTRARIVRAEVHKYRISSIEAP
jgi:hypothetical protein